MKKVVITVLIVLLALGLWLMLRPTEPPVEIFDRDENTPEFTIFDSQAAIEEQERNDQAVTIQEYITKNISSLSAEAGAPEVLGGTFYVTKFEAKKGSGTISYEDGHNAYTADFTYTTDKKGLVSVKTFVVRK